MPAEDQEDEEEPCSVKNTVLEEHYEEPFTREPMSGSNLELRYEEEEPMYEPYMQDEELDYEPAPEPSVEEGEPIYEPDMQDEELDYERAPDPVVEEERPGAETCEEDEALPEPCMKEDRFQEEGNVQDESYVEDNLPLQIPIEYQSLEDIMHYIFNDTSVAEEGKRDERYPQEQDVCTNRKINRWMHAKEKEDIVVLSFDDEDDGSSY